MSEVFVAIVAIFACWTLLKGVEKTSQACQTVSPSAREFDWLSITPSKRLVWVACYRGNRQCARLIVPLDYSNPSGQTASIALIRVPSLVPRTNGLYRGPILFNPGGPGGSGVDLVNLLGDRFQVLLGPEFDIVGFDPRGVGRTTPQVNVFSEYSERLLWYSMAGLQLINSSADALAQAYARAKVFNQLVEDRTKLSVEHVSTAVVSRDMLSIIKAYGRDKLLYWGFSYGSVLGITYAAMFPNNIERLVVDGVVDADNYYATLWSNNLLDTDKGLKLFYSYCVSAGPLACPLHEDSIEKVAARVDNILLSVKETPLAVHKHGAYGVITYSILKSFLFLGLYKPYNLLSILAQLFAAIEKGDGSGLLLLAGVLQGNRPICECPKWTGLPYEPRGEAQTAVICTDGEEVQDSLRDAAEYFENLAKMSVFAEAWPIRLSCVGYKIKAKSKFIGPFVGNTSFPLLLIGNTADPVTPLSSAKKMSNGFPGAVVLTQNSAGHCSLAAISICTQKHIRAYFRNGKLPDPNTVCEIESNFFSPADTVERQVPMSGEDIEMLDVVRQISHDFEVPKVLPRV